MRLLMRAALAALGVVPIRYAEGYVFPEAAFTQALAQAAPGAGVPAVEPAAVPAQYREVQGRVERFTSETFKSESDARREMDWMADFLRRDGSTVVSSRVYENRGGSTYRWYYVIEYRKGYGRPPPDRRRNPRDDDRRGPGGGRRDDRGRVQTYQSQDYHYHEDAERAMRDSERGFRRAGYEIISAQVYRRGRSYYYVIEYLPENGRRPR